MTIDGNGAEHRDVQGPAGTTPPDRTAVRIPAPARLGPALVAVAIVAILGAALIGSIAIPRSAPAAVPSTSPSPAASVPAVAASGTPTPLGPVLGRGGVVLPLTHEVFGFLPYWKADDATLDSLRYDLLSTVALFGMGIRKDGAIRTNTPGYRMYTGETGARVTADAHARGVRVVPTFQLFDKGELPNMTAFLGDPEARAAFVEAAMALMAEHDADGAVLDFEPLPDSLTAEFAAFAGELGRAIHAKDPAAQLTVALHQAASDAQVAAIAPAVDRIFVMAYDYHWVGSATAGPVAPLDGLGGDVTSTLARFVGAAGREKVILGVPYFGYDWPVAFRGPGAPVVQPASDAGGAWSVAFTAAEDFLAQHPTVAPAWDPVAASPWFTYRDAKNETERQVWYEDARSLAAKYALAKADGVVGVGIWALGMDRGRTELWELLRSTFGRTR